MITHLITGGCSFSTGGDSWGWTGNLTNYLKKNNPELTTEHTGYLSQGQELIQKKIILALTDAFEKGIKPENILVVPMWSGTNRKAWYIDNPDIINQITQGMRDYVGGMSSQFMDLKNNTFSNDDYFCTSNGTKFSYNPRGGWYFTVNGGESNMAFIKEHYLLDNAVNGIGKVHASIENMVMLQNFCNLHNVKLVHQFFMDSSYQDILDNVNHQMINYLYKQLNVDNMILYGMFEYLHQYLPVERSQSIRTSHEDRRKLDADRDYFAKDGFHPGEYGHKVWCQEMLFPFLEHKGIQ